jgi:hypothetical protein
MSYEGYVEYLCENGHYCQNGAYETDHTRCPLCNGKLTYINFVDETNGEDKDDPCTMPAETEVIGNHKVAEEDAYGNSYFVDIPKLKPASDRWRAKTEFDS